MRRGRVGKLGDVAEQIDRRAADRAAGTHRGRAASPARGTCRRSARTGCAAGSCPLRRSARRCPGRYQTGSIATLTTDRPPPGWTTTPSMASRPAATACCISPRSSRARVTAMLGRMSMPCGDLRPEGFGDHVAPRIERDDGLGADPLRERADGNGGLRVGEVGPSNRIERAGGDGKRAVDRIGAAMRADDVAVGWPRHRADDGSALARRRRAPGNGKARLGARRGMRGEANMVCAVRTAHDRYPKMPTARRSGGPTPTAVIDAAAAIRVPTGRHYSCITSGNKAQETKRRKQSAGTQCDPRNDPRRSCAKSLTMQGLNRQRIPQCPN